MFSMFTFYGVRSLILFLLFATVINNTSSTSGDSGGKFPTGEVDHKVHLDLRISSQFF